MNRKRRKHLEALAHIARALKAERETGPMRKVLVLLFGLDRVLLCGDLVLEVPSEMTDEEVSTWVEDNADNLPLPEQWERVDRGNVEVSPDILAHTVFGEVEDDRGADARIVRDEDGEAETIA